MWKTTTLRLIGGFEKPTSGKIIFEGVDITDMPPYKGRSILFSEIRPVSHMNVFENIAFGLRIKTDKKVISEKVSRMLKLVNLKASNAPWIP